MKYTFKLNIVNKEKVNRIKQMNAFMPNLIHSLDAASLALFVDLFFKHLNIEVKNFYSIHDCFGVTANNVDKLISLLKSVYIYIYSNDSYLIKLDSEIISNIKNQYGEKSFDENRIITTDDGLTLQYPDINIVLGSKLGFDSRLDFNVLKKSSYILH